MRGGNRGGALKVVLIVLGVVVLCVALGGIYVAMNWKTITANMANVAAEQVVKDSGLPDDQKEEILTEIRQLADDFKSGRISVQQLAEVGKTISDGPLIPLAGVQLVRHKYIEPSAMKPEEKASSILTVQRLARGVYEKRIPKSELEEVVKPIADHKRNGNWKLKENATDMEVSQFVANAKASADAAKIPNEPFDLNIADELKKALHGS